MIAKILTTLFVLLLAATAQAEDPDILHIRKEYQAIRNALPNLTTETADLPDHSTEGGQAWAYRDDNKIIRLVKAELYFETGKIVREFYYESEKPFFVFDVKHSYNVPFYFTPELAKEVDSEPFDPQKTKITENRYYVRGDRMIRWLDENKIPVNPQSAEFMDAELEILNTAEEMLSFFK